MFEINGAHGSKISLGMLLLMNSVEEIFPVLARAKKIVVRRLGWIKLFLDDLMSISNQI